MKRSDFKVCLWYQAQSKITSPENRQSQVSAIQIRKGEGCWQVQAKKTQKGTLSPIYHIFSSSTLEEAIDWVFDNYVISEIPLTLKNQLIKDAEYLDRAVSLYSQEIAQRIRYVLQYIG